MAVAVAGRKVGYLADQPILDKLNYSDILENSV